ncbi:MAG: VOC family protein [Treponema sp.]|nr:VOC family protein [Treponema sp.]
MKLETWAYVDGIDEAVSFYQKVFGAKISTEGTWKNDNGTYEICAFELDDGTSFSLAERKGESAIEGEVNTGNIMQMCLLYKKEDLPKLEKAYELLKEGANIRHPLQSAAWTSHTCDLIDKYGLRWCLMVW